MFFFFALIAGCSSAPPRVADQPKVELPPPPVTAPAPVVEALPSPPSPPPPAVAEITVLPAREDDLWMRIRSGFAMSDLETPLVKQHEQWYASRPDYVQRMTERSQLYLFHIVEEVERRKLPSEIALLPMIESAFNPQAYSRSRASGIWQFIPSTGKHFGLNQNWWYDGRRNVLSATNAALDYLEKLHAMFGSWPLALAAYNCGEGCVARAIAKNQARGLPTDLLSLKLPGETRHYVPKLLAVRNIIADPDAFGLKLNDVPNKPFFAAVDIDKHIDVALAARFADMTVEEFTALNPAYNQRVITYNDNVRLLLPASKVAMFSANMRRYGDQQLHSWQAYQGRAGESVDKIAGRFGITSGELRSLNTVKEKRGKLKSPQLLLVPMHLTKPLPTAAQIAAAQPPPLPIDATQPRSYVVQKGDTLFSLAKRYGTTVEALVAHNDLEQAVVKVGETLEIPATGDKLDMIDVAAVSGEGDGGGEGDVVESKVLTAVSQREVQPKAAQLVVVQASPRVRAPAPASVARTNRPAPAARDSFYTVRRGDTLYSIAKAFRVTVADLMQWNRLHQKSTLMPGVKMQVFAPVR